MAWTANAPDVAYYVISVCDDAANEQAARIVGASAEPNTLLTSLTAGQQYRLAVAAVDSDGRQGTFGAPVVITVRDPDNNVPVFTGRIGLRAAVGQTYLSQVLSRDLDGDDVQHGLVDAPLGMSISLTGLIEWTPTPDQVGMHTFGVLLDDGAGGINQRSFTIHVAEPEVGNRPPEILSQAPVEAEPGAPYTYAVVIRASDGEGLSDLQRFTIQADTDPPALAAEAWGTLTATGPDAIGVEAVPVPDATGLTEFQLEVDGTPLAWQVPAQWVVVGLAPNTSYQFRMKARDASVLQNETGWSNVLAAYTLANVPPAPSLVTAEEHTLHLSLAPGSNPDYTQLALWDASAGTWLGLDGGPSSTPVWAEASTWGAVVVGPLAVDTVYHYRVKARNEDRVETDFSDVLAAKTLAPNSAAALIPTQDWLYENADGSTVQQVTVTASFASDPFENGSYSYTWLAPPHPETGQPLTLVAGGGSDDATAVYAAPPAPAASAVPYEIRCVITGVDHGNYAIGTLQVTVYARGDLDRDGDVDVNDFAVFAGCVAGPGVTTPPPGCDPDDFANADLDGDSDVDLADFSRFQRAFTGSP